LITDFVSRRQFAEDDINALGSESPPRPTMRPGEHMNADQFRGLVGPDGAEPPVSPARHPHYLGGENGPSVHEWLSGTNRDETNGSADR
jgi:hypothetical protein